MLGLVIYLLMMATAFMGYVLPWGQMSYWGAQVITGFFSAFPMVGEPLRIWLLGGYAPDQAALTRFFSLHYLLPFVIAAVVILHIWALHIPGSSNPTGVDVKDEKDTLPFHPFYTAKDGWFAAGVLLVFALLTYFRSRLSWACRQLHSGQSACDTRGNRSGMVFLAVLRDPALVHGRFHPPGQAVGVLAMFSSILLLFFLPWIDRSPVRSGSYRPMLQALFLASCHRRTRSRMGRRGRSQPDQERDQPDRGAYYFLHSLVILRWRLDDRFRSEFDQRFRSSRGEEEAAPLRTKRKSTKTASATAE